MADQSPPIPLEHLESVKQALIELFHCVEAGPAWFTNGRSAQLAHAARWYRKAEASVKEIEDWMA